MDLLPGKKHDPIKPTKKYGPQKVKAVQNVYLGFILLWIILIFYLKLYRTTYVGYFILFIPIFFYLLGYNNADQLTIEVEEKTYSVGYISIALLVVIPVLTWTEKNFHGDKWYLTKIVIAAIIMALISLVDIWVRPKWISVVRHIKSSLQTMALTLLVFALYEYYNGQHIARRD